MWIVLRKIYILKYLRRIGGLEVRVRDMSKLRSFYNMHGSI